jgi:metal-responsive CopG/Arc/MetJ family transcriptional regulator
MMAGSDWVTVKLPKELAEQIDRALKQRNAAYPTRAELVREAVRAYLTAQKRS